MARLSQRQTYSLDLDISELRLVLKSLGKRLTDEEAILAEQIGDRISVMREQATRNLIQQSEKLFENLQKAGLVQQTKDNP